MVEYAGYTWLLQAHDARLIQPLTIQSQIGTGRHTRSTEGRIVETYPATYRPDATFEGHMTFALKYEGVHLEALSRIFANTPESTVADWANRERSGQYARRTGFLYEWLTGKQLDGVEALKMGNYVDAIEGSMQLVASAAENNQRWRVRDNMPGTREYCPMVFRTEAVAAAEAYDCAASLNVLNAEFGTDVLLRSAVWLTIKESRSSFLIEREERRQADIVRFATAMERYCGTAANPLDEGFVTKLQKEIIGSRTTLNHFGFRQSPVFIGSMVNYENVVHYVAPQWSDVPGMMQGLAVCLDRTVGLSPVVRAAVGAFSFVYIHPLADGNGRTHRFLINDILRRDGAVPSPYILPVSATITHSPAERARYDRVLELFSKPLMNAYRDSVVFGKAFSYEDGIDSDFIFLDYADATVAWRYPDLTKHVEYLSDVIDKTIREEMTNEARALRDWDRARNAMKQVIDGPDRDIDRIIRSLRENRGVVTNSLRKEYPVLDDPEVASEAAAAVASVFDAQAPASDAANDAGWESPNL